MSSQNKLTIKSALELVYTDDLANVCIGLKQLEVCADLSVIEPIVAIASITTNRAVKKEVLEFLSNVIDPKLPPLFLPFIQEEKYASIRQELLSVVWNSKLDYSSFLADFVEVAIEGNFIIALECLTVLENLEGPFEEHQLLESQLHLKEYIASDRSMEDDQKTTVISEIALYMDKSSMLLFWRSIIVWFISRKTSNC